MFYMFGCYVSNFLSPENESSKSVQNCSEPESAPTCVHDIPSRELES